MCEKQPLVQVLAWVIFCICSFILSWKGHHTSLPVWICLHKLPSRLKCAKINYNYWQLPVKSLCHCEHCSNLNWGLFHHEPLSFHIYLILQWSYCIIWRVPPSSSLELQQILSNQYKVARSVWIPVITVLSTQTKSLLLVFSYTSSTPMCIRLW